ncbi:GroES-like protein, partial [Hymenopellis radicata]
MSTHTAIATTSLGVFEAIQVPTPKPQEGEVLLKAEYASMIAFDTYQTDLGYMIAEYPVVLGFNAAGTVAEVGPGVDDLKVGDKVTAFTYQNPKQKGVQQYSIQSRSVCAKVPESMSLAAAATVPDNFVTAFRTLFADLGLPYPTSYPAKEPPAGANSAILIYGAGSTAGQYAIQLLRASGYKNVIATASPHHHEFLKSLGAREVFDYRSSSLTEDIIGAASGRVVLVLDCISAEATIATIAHVIDPLGTLAILLPIKRGSKVRADGDASAMYWEIPADENPLPKGVTVKGVRAFLYQDFEYLKENLMPKILPSLLEQGIIQPNRVKLLAEGSLKDRVAVGLDLLRNNKVSGEKVVVKI